MLTKQMFTQQAKPLNASINGQPVVVDVKSGATKPFSSGKMGWYANGKVTIQLPNGELVRCQMSVQLVAIGSDEWPAGDQQFAAAAAGS